MINKLILEFLLTLDVQLQQWELFGIIKMEDGMEEIKGLGMVHWEIMGANGNMPPIKVPAHCMPTVEM